MAKYFARIRALVKKYDIDATRLFNLDETGFGMKGMTFGRSKCIVETKDRANTKELKLKGIVDRIKLMPVVSAAGN